MEINKIYNMDCLIGMKDIPDKSIDMILIDLPYGMTSCKWDCLIDFNNLWSQLERIIKPNSAMVFTACQAFTSKLVMSNLKLFKHEWIYQKGCGSNFAQVKYAPFREHENILVFSIGKPKYYPIKEERSLSAKSRIKCKHSPTPARKDSTTRMKCHIHYRMDEKRYPSTIQKFNNRGKNVGLHPTQKPVELFEYFIKTYSQERDLILDACMGSGTTAIACINTGRNYIGFELDKEYFDVANKRIEEHLGILKIGEELCGTIR